MALGKTRSRLLDEIDIYELFEWQQFWVMEGGFGDIKRDQHFGQLCSLLANINRDVKKRSTPFGIEEFWLRPAPKKQDNTKKIMAAFDALTSLKPRRI